MTDDSLSQRKAQLDKAEREHLEDVVEELRERVEDNVRYQLTQKGLDDEPGGPDTLDEDIEQLVEAIELEGVDGHTWDEAFEQYVTGVGYTIVNRLAALRCMEVRDFIDEEVTVFKENGLTPAAETLVHEEFLLEDEAILEAHHTPCDELAEEIEILFDRSSSYSLVDPDDDTFEALCGMLDDVPDEVWRADDVLGWVYEYYNRPVVGRLTRRTRSNLTTSARQISSTRPTGLCGCSLTTVWGSSISKRPNKSRQFPRLKNSPLRKEKSASSRPKTHQAFPNSVGVS